ITVVDITAPMITTCATNRSATADTNSQAAVPDFTASVTAADDCSVSVTLTQSPAIGTLLGVGAHEITITARDAASNGVTCTATFTVDPHPVPPSIVTQPQDQTNQLGSNATVSVSATSSLPIQYQWYFNGTNALELATNATLVLTNLQLTNAGSYLVILSGDGGSVTSAPAILTVNQSPVAANHLAAT